jgi:hypothetical protein
MSTRPIERDRLTVTRQRPPALWRAIAIAALFALVFAAAFAIGHSRSAPARRADGLPPSLPSVSSPVPSSLGQAPPIELGVAQQPPETQSTPATTSGTETGSGATTLGGSTTPTATTPAITAPAITTPATKTPTTEPPTTRHTAPATSGGGAKSTGKPSSPGKARKPTESPSTSFDSSG